jgi:hypothetical protein
MIACDITQSGAVLLMLLVAEMLLPLPILVGVRAVAGLEFLPASRSAVPSLVVDDDLDRANAGLGLGVNLAETLGPVLAAALLSALDVRAALLVTAAVFGFSALLVSRLPPLPPAPDAEEEDVGFLYGAVGLAAGLSYVLGGLALNATSARVVFVAAGAGGLLVTGATAAVLLRQARAHRPSES